MAQALGTRELIPANAGFNSGMTQLGLVKEGRTGDNREDYSAAFAATFFAFRLFHQVWISSLKCS